MLCLDPTEEVTPMGFLGDPGRPVARKCVPGFWDTEALRKLIDASTHHRSYVGHMTVTF